MNGNVREMFPGGNTSRGFYSFYRFILPQEEAKRIFVIKGGPGTGKSTLMKKIASYFNEKGYDIELHHCSSDNNSLDGVVIKGLNVALIDGTSPHVVDPQNPGVVDEIVNMGQCWNVENLSKYRKEVTDLNKEIGRTFKRAYRYIGAAKIIHEDWSGFNQEALNLQKLNEMKRTLQGTFFSKDSIGSGYERHLFATAFTPDGIVTYIDSLCSSYENIYVLNGEPGTGKSEILSFLAQESTMHGYDVEIYHKPLLPEQIEHIIIPKLSTAILTSNEINQKNFSGHQLYTENLINSSLRVKYRNNIASSKDTFYSLLNKGLSIIGEAKSLHDQMEKYYVGSMDFEKINAVYEELIKRIAM